MPKYFIEDPVQDLEAVSDTKPEWKVFRDGKFVEPPCESREAAITRAGYLEREDLIKYLDKRKAESQRDYEKSLKALQARLDELDQQIETGKLPAPRAPSAKVEESPSLN
ncbi:hypothetical protein [Pseudomonas sp. BNK-15]|uniref:hypothetical protein n=1 Tax=Pseudomonas sp. BNK-15 TaxID=3376152 RepID=UPI0039BF7C16